MPSLIGLIPIAIQIVVWLVIASVILSMLSRVFEGNWVYAPFFWAIISFGRKLCDPVRRLMERCGIPSRPFDFSPMVVVFGLNFLERLVLSILFPGP
jgi:uncharacterized protein YggT (Ycf19 family)